MDTDRSHLSAIFNGRRRGHYTKKRIVKELQLTRDEVMNLGWLS